MVLCAFVLEAFESRFPLQLIQGLIRYRVNLFYFHDNPATLGATSRELARMKSNGIKTGHFPGIMKPAHLERKAGFS